MRKHYLFFEYQCLDLFYWKPCICHVTLLPRPLGRGLNCKLNSALAANLDLNIRFQKLMDLNLSYFHLSSTL